LYFKISILNKMAQIAYFNKSLGKIVADDFGAAEIFKEAGIDFCCGGKKSFLQAYKEKNIDTTV
jgi:regulator of cell morphogenesis and NO signaling